MQGAMNVNFSPAMAQRSGAPQISSSVPAGNGTNIGGPGQNNRVGSGSLASVMPTLTDEMKMKLRALFEEVARNNVQLKDLTMLLSEKDKAQVKECMVRITQQYANVDSILSYFYVLTRNIEGTKRLIQMKNMTKNIIENLQRGVYLAGPDLLEKMRSQYQKHFDYVKDQINIRRAQQARHQSQAQSTQAGQQQLTNDLTQMPQGHQQFVAQNAMQQQTPQTFNAAALVAPVNVPAHQRQQFNRNDTAAAVTQTNMPQNIVMPQRVESSPLMPPTTSPMAQRSTGRTPAAKKPVAANKRKVGKSTSAIPTPAASAATPAAVANAIKTPNSIATPQLPPPSNKGTPIDVSPQNELKNNAIEKPPISGDVFETSSADIQLVKRRELSKSDPEQFFFLALTNLLELNGSETKESLVEKDTKKSMQSPLSPTSSGEWTATVKAQAIKTAFCQVEAIAELTGSDILRECAKVAEKELEEASNKKRKREDAEDDIDLLFEDEKTKSFGDDFERHLFAPIEFDDWKSWLSGLQQT